MKKFVAILSAVLLVLTVTACGTGNNSNKLVGQWKQTNTDKFYFDELEFFSDNTYGSNDVNYNGNYSVDGNRIKLDGILVSPITATYTVNNKELILEFEASDFMGRVHEKEMVFEKVKD